MLAATTFSIDTGQWIPSKLISNDKSFATVPFLVADRSGVIHAVWSQSTLKPNDELALDTIMYARFVNGQWSAPVDILATNTPPLRAARLRIDHNDILHLLVVGSEDILYSTAHLTNAVTARGWTTSELGILTQAADFALEPDGTVHFVYALDRRGIFHIVSGPSRLNLSSPTTVWIAASEDYSSGNVRIERGPDGVLHTAWGITGAVARWNPIGVAYARSTDSGYSWEQTLEVLEGDNLPNIGFDKDGGIHLIWNNPAGSSLGRGHALSSDSGLTWPHTERIFHGYRGQTWWPSMAQDSAGTLHLITAANPPNGANSRLFHSMWLDNKWSDPVMISGQLEGGEGPSLTVSNGNQLHVAWFSFVPSQFGIWTSSSFADAPYLEDQKILMAETRLIPSAVTPETKLPMLTTQPPATITPLIISSQDSEVLQASSRSNWLMLLTGVIPVVLLLSSVLLSKLRKVS